MNINGLGGKMTAVILAGGKSSRFGRDKSLLTVDGRLLLERSLDNWGSLFAEVIIVSESGGKFSFLKDVKETADIYRGRGPLGGVHAGLKLSSSPWSFVAACDMPHIDKELIAHLCAAVTEESKVVLPFHNGHIEPLCGLYHKDCLAAAEKMLAENSNCILDMYDLVPTLFIESENCFFNINFPSDAEDFENRRENLSKSCKRSLREFSRKQKARKQN